MLTHIRRAIKRALKNALKNKDQPKRPWAVHWARIATFAKKERALQRAQEIVNGPVGEHFATIQVTGPRGYSAMVTRQGVTGG